MNLLTLNAGSSSIKYKVFDQSKKPFISGLIEGIGEIGGNWTHGQEKNPHHFQDHEQAFAALGEKLKLALADQPIQGVGHRVVHGGNRYFQPTIISNEVLAEIRALAKLAPIHNPINALGIDFAKKQFPDALQVAIFDNGFHHTMPEHVRHYAIKTDTADKYQIRRYGFHGINHEYVAKQAAIFLHKDLKDCNFISLHLGNGASACLIKKGESFDTSMGMTPLAGLVMGTRCGDIDPAIVLYLQEQGLSCAEVDKLLNKESGLKGIANENDMRKLIARTETNDETAILAMDTYVYAVQKIIGAYYSQLEVLDALIFTGGVGENASLIRDKIISPLHHMDFKLDENLNLMRTDAPCHAISKSGIPLLVIRGDEEALMAEKVAELVVFRELKMDIGP